MRMPSFCLALSLGALFACSGCFDGYTPSSGEQGRAEIAQTAVHSYLAKADLARPEIVQAVTITLRQGSTFRKRVRDQSNKWCLATVWVDQRNNLHVVTSRNETCPVCNGTGKRKWTNKVMETMPFDTECLKCKGKGFLEHHTVERKYTLSPMDYTDPKAARAAVERSAYRHAPAGAQRYIDMLPDKDPKTRLAACVWLDQNYVHEGLFFQDIDPMLRKARQRDQNKKVMVWQWWAGRGLPGEHNRAYYRVYAYTKTGKIFRKGFYPEP